MNRLLRFSLAIALLAALPLQAALLVPSGSPNWRFKNGLSEASTPVTAWRGSNFNDSAFTTLPAPFWYGDVLPGGTMLTDMLNSYTCFFLRHSFVVTNVAEIEALQLRSLIDDGYVIWINGIEAHRFGVADPLTISTLATNQAADPAVFNDYTLTNSPASVLVVGTNYLCVQVFNTTLASSDIGFDCQLTSVIPDFTPPTVASRTPAAGPVGDITTVTVNFSEPVTGVDAGDLLLNGSPALSVSGSAESYTFSFARPPEGVLNMTWAAANNIYDLAVPPNAFDGAAAGNTWQYTFSDTVVPVVISVSPATNTVVRTLTHIDVHFSEPVTNVDAGDLRVNGVAATGLEYGAPGQFLFTFTQPATGTVQITWAPGHGIRDLANVPNNFGGAGWTYVLDPNVAFFDVRINEFMADNENGLKDEDASYQDWIELYNASSTAVDLTGWYLTDLVGNLTQWKFPTVIMQPNTYLLVWASGKNRTNNPASLHANFSLRKEGEYLGLVLPDGTNVVSSFAPYYPEQATDVSYGRDQLDPSLLYYFSPSTPRSRNTNSPTFGITAEVNYSRAGGTFLDPFTLQLSCATSNAVIRYVIITNSTQASASVTNVPTTTSPIYTNPIPIFTNAATIVRARAFAPGLLASDPKTECYIPIDQTMTQFSSDLPVVVIHNLGAGTPPQKSPQQTAILMSFGNDNGRAKVANAPDLVTRVGEHLRGSSTVGFAKWNLSVEFWDDYNQDQDHPFIGMPSESDWVFQGINGFDPGLMHNKIYQWLGEAVGIPNQRTRFAEVFIKSNTGPLSTNDYFGLYLIEEKVKVSNNRLDIPRLQIEDTNAPAVTGGYLMKIDRQDATERGFSPPQIGSIRTTPAPIVYVDPGYSPTESDSRLMKQINYMQGYILNFITNLSTVGYTNPVTGYAQYIDTDQWVDHLVANIVPFNVDGYRLSGYFYKDRNARMTLGPQWDCDRCMGTGGTTTPQTDNRCFSPRYWRLPVASGDPDNGTDFFGVSTIGVSWFTPLFRDPNFWQRFIDRYQMHRTNQLSTNVVFAMIDGWHQEIMEAQVRDQVRWGGLWGGVQQSFNFPRSGSQTVNGYTFDFGAATNAGRGAFHKEVEFQKRWFADRFEFIDTNFLAMPKLSRGTEQLPSGTTITITPAAKANTRLLYTLNGTDPRLPGGAISPAALSNASGPLTITITSNVHLFVRCYNTSHANQTNGGGSIVGYPLINSFWSGPAAATYFTVPPTLRITEVMYNPAKPPAGNTNDADNFEYIELKNTGATAINLSGFRLSGGIDLTFTNVVLAAGQYCVAVRHTAAFQSRYGAGVQIAGQYTNNLANDGDHIVLTGPLGEPIHDFTYGGGWYELADGTGFSLTLVNENVASTNYSTNISWRISATDKGSPGQADPAPSLLPMVVINEAVTHTSSTTGDTIELRNLSATNAPVGYWYLTDEFDTPRKYQIPSDVIIPAGGYVVFNELATFGLGASGFGLSSKGEEVYLFSADAAGNLNGWYHGFGFGAQFTNASFGRYVDSQGVDRFVSQKTNSLGSANPGPKVGPVVISEIMYHPPDINAPFVAPDNVVDEFIELQNITTQPVSLFHTIYGTNTWKLRNAVDYQFPQGVTLPAGGYALVVSFDPADAAALSAFRTKYSVPAGVPVFGPYDGKLDNSADEVELAAPDLTVLPPAADAGFVPYILMDKVGYTHAMPWNAAPDGYGPSLQRLVVGDYGNDATNWFAAGPNPGAPSVSGSQPVILQHPASQNVVGGTSVTFDVVVGGLGPFSYQWLWQGSPIYGATAPSYTVPNAQLASQGTYNCLVMNSGGAVFSSNANLIVRMPATLTQQPTNYLVFIRPDPKGAPSTNITFYANAFSTNPPVFYQWRKNGANIPGATNTSITVSNVGIPEEGYYSCAVTDGIGTTVTSNALLQPLITPVWQLFPIVAYVTNGTNITITSNNITPLITVSTGAFVRMSAQLTAGYPFPITYEWRQGSIGFGPDSTNVVSRLYDFYTFQAPFTIVNGTTYRVVAKNAYIYSTTPPASGVAYNFRVTTYIDSDGDGIADNWGTNYFNTTNTAALSGEDTDGDGMNNYEEYVAGTNPTNALSVLKVSPLSPTGAAKIEFPAISNRTYTVEYTDDLGAGVWEKLGDAQSYPTNRTERFIDPAAGTNRIYRVRVPQRW